MIDGTDPPGCYCAVTTYGWSDWMIIDISCSPASDAQRSDKTLESIIATHIVRSLSEKSSSLKITINLGD